MTNTPYTIPPEMREFAEKSVEQAKKAFEGFFEAANKAGDETKSKVTDASDKVIEYAKANVEAGLDYAKRLSMARSPEEIWAIQNEFIRSQSAAFMAQSKEAAKNFKA